MAAPPAWWAWVVDITALKEAQRRSDDASERLRVAQEAGGIGMFDIDVAHQRAAWTPQLEHLFGLPIGSHDGTVDFWLRHVHPDDREAAERHYRATLADPEASELRGRVPRAAARWARAAVAEHRPHRTRQTVAARRCA